MQDTYRAEESFALAMQKQVIDNHALALVPAESLSENPGDHQNG
jgi:hypothetical protein